MAEIVPLRPEVFIPLRFESPPEEMIAAHDDYERATFILQWAQKARNEVFQRGEPLPAPKRNALLAMLIIAQDHEVL